MEENKMGMTFDEFMTTLPMSKLLQYMEMLESDQITDDQAVIEMILIVIGFHEAETGEGVEENKVMDLLASFVTTCGVEAGVRQGLMLREGDYILTDGKATAVSLTKEGRELGIQHLEEE